jgi:putative ABC transport system permease protein
MVVFGAFTARHRAQRVPDAFCLASRRSRSRRLRPRARGRPRIFDPTPGTGPGRRHGDRQLDDRGRRRLNRLGEDVSDQSRRIEATLALGATSSQAMTPLVKRSLRSGMITLVDSTKTTGLIFFPGTMVGMLLAGADPTDAVRLQLILLYVLLGAASIAALMSITLARRNFFTPAHQLREPPEP